MRNDDQLLYILLADSNAGLAWINEFLSMHLLEKKVFPEKAIDQPFLTTCGTDLLPTPFKAKAPGELFPKECIGLRPGEVNKLFAIDTKGYTACFVIRQQVTFLDKVHYNLHRLLRAIDKNVLLSKLPVEAECDKDESFVSPGQLLEALQNYPAIVTNTYKLIEDCNIQVEFHTDKNKQVFSGSAEDDRILLAKLAKGGLSFRYGNNKLAKARVEKELMIINQLGFNAYFLITWDLS